MKHDMVMVDRDELCKVVEIAQVYTGMQGEMVDVVEDFFKKYINNGKAPGAIV